MGWTWLHTYPDRVAVTLLLHPAEARQIIDHARNEGTLIAPNTILPKATKAASKVDASAETAPVSPGKRSSPKVAKRRPSKRVRSNVTILPCVQHKRVAEVPAHQRKAGQVLSMERPRSEPPNIAAKKVDGETRELIDKAIDDGRVTHCPPRKHAFDAAEPQDSWRKSNRRNKAPKQRPEVCGEGRQRPRRPSLDQLDLTNDV